MFPASNGNLRVPSPKAGSNNNSAYQENLSDYLENISRHPRTSSSTSRNAGNDNASDKPLVHLVHPPKGPQIHSSEEPYTVLTIARPFDFKQLFVSSAKVVHPSVSHQRESQRKCWQHSGEILFLISTENIKQPPTISIE